MTHSSGEQPPGPALLELRGISKRFGKAQVLEDVSLRLGPGEVLGLLGENGAGKSTLMKIVMGVYAPNSGEVWVDGVQRAHTSPDAAMNEGLAMVYQELSLVPQLTVAQNVALGAERPNRIGMLSDRGAEEACVKLCEEFGITLDPRAKVESLPFGQRQVVELLKALNRRARVLILDEPTASLTAGEQEALFETVRKLAGRGRGVIFISHRLREVLGLTDRIEVLRNGRNAGTATTSEADIPTLVRMMVGSREVSERQRILAHPQPSASTETLLHVTGLSTRHKLRDCSFDVRKGEVLGLTGLLGAGRSTLLRCLFGLQKISDGQMRLTGEPYRPRDPQDAIRRGVVLVPEDRGTQGIFPGLSVQDNLTSACWEKISAWPALGGWTPERRRWTRRLAQQQFDELRVKAQNLKQALGELSGGTQQKVVLAKWILRQPHLLLCDEPTAGVDVGTKDEIWRILRDLADRGMSVLYSSSDLEELSVVSDRVLVMADGTVAAEITDPDELRDDERLRTSVQRVAAHVRQGAGGAGPTTWRSAS